jgi:peptide-methionine (S)-S-oxide reductase
MRSMFARLLRCTGLLALLAMPAVGTAEAAAEDGEAMPGDISLATFAGGCFWCMEPPFDHLDGVLSTTAGYAGGPEPEPRYEDVAAGRTGHAEVVQVAFNPARISYEALLRVFWRNIDPFAVDRQFCDSGPQYRSAIFFHDEGQRRAAEATLAEIQARFEGQQIATRIVAVGDTFHPAEEYHQDYYRKNPVRYRLYRYNCGRDRRLEQIWGDEAGG